MDIQCSECNFSASKCDLIFCGVCQSGFHFKCTKLTNSDRATLDSNENIFWKCGLCINFSSISCIQIVKDFYRIFTERKSDFDNIVKPIRMTRSQIKSVPTVQNKNNKQLLKEKNISSSPRFVYSPLSKSSLSPSLASKYGSNNKTLVKKPVSCKKSSKAAVASSVAAGPTSLSDGSDETNVAVVDANAAAATNVAGSVAVDMEDDVGVANVAFKEVEKGTFTKNLKQTKNVNDHRSKKTLIGTAAVSDGEFTLQSVPRLRFLHLSRLEIKVTEENVKDYAASKLNIPKSSLRCTKLIKKDADSGSLRYVNFKLGIPANIFDSALDPKIWPVHVQIKKFVNFPKKEDNSKVK